jgi:hypothetical protein
VHYDEPSFDFPSVAEGVVRAAKDQYETFWSNGQFLAFDDH